MHFASSDYAQQILLPTCPDQVGGLYFKTGRKIQLFGVADEGSGVQEAYFMDEGVESEKGSVSAAPFLDNHLSKIPFRINRLELQANNCVGLNKNNFIMLCICWLASRGEFGIEEAAIHFMIPGHAKFRVDGFFGLGKSALAKKEAGCILTMKSAWKSSVSGRKQERALVADPIAGEVLAPTRNWKAFRLCFKISNIFL